VTAPVYHAPRSLAEALAVLQEFRGAGTVLAGGQDIVPLMNQGRLAPTHLVDIARLEELRNITEDAGLTIGALATHADLVRHGTIRSHLPLLVDAVRQMGGGLQVRNRGTIGGSLCAANPAYDLPACLLVLDAVLVLAGAAGVRRVSSSAFFLGAGRTVRRDDELLTAIEIPALPTGAGSAYVKLKFMEGGYTIAGAACVLVASANGTCREARLAVSGVSAVPRRISAAEAVLAGHRVTSETLAAVSAQIAGTITDPIEDVMAPADYRREMAGVMAARAVAEAAAR